MNECGGEIEGNDPPAAVNNQTDDKGLLLLCPFSVMGRCAGKRMGELTFLVPFHLLIDVLSMSSS